jgi:hypothetical protein
VKRALWLLLSLALLAALVWARWPETEAPDAGPAVVSQPTRTSAPPSGPPDPDVASEESSEPSVDGTEPAVVPEAAAGEAKLRLEPKLASEPLSEVPHELVGAWDDRRGEPELGKHRVLVAVVSPDAGDAEIERLLRDAQARHREAEVLDVRVYDSDASARKAGWLGERRLVGEIKRNDRLGYEAMMVRGALVPR